MADNQALALVVRQAGGTMLPADPQGRYLHRFQIRSESINRHTGLGNLYTISWDTATRQWCCSCPGWITSAKRGQRGCKHLSAMAPGLARIGMDRPPTSNVPQIEGPRR